MRHFRDRRWMLGGALAAIAVAALIFAVNIHGVAAQDGAAVSIVDFAFEPATIEVPAGATVTWTNLGRGPHTVSDAGEFNSGLLAPGATFSLTFNEPGSYPYFCKIHPDTMTGTVIVTGAAAAPPPEAPAAEPPELAGVGVGRWPPTGTQALLAAIAAAACGVGAIVSTPPSPARRRCWPPSRRRRALWPPSSAIVAPDARTP